MIPWLMSRLAVNPSATFSEAELRAHNTPAFLGLRDERLLERRAIVPRRLLVREGRSLTVAAGGSALLEAFDEDDPEFVPVEVTTSELGEWGLNLDRWTRRFRERHGLTGATVPKTDRIRLLGSLEGDSVFLVLAFGADEAVGLLWTLRDFAPRARTRIAVLPAVELDGQAQAALEARRVAVAALDGDGFGLLPPIAQLRTRPISNEWLEPLPGLRRSHDSRSVTLHGAPFSLTTRQVQAFDVLLEAVLNGTPDVSNAYVEDAIGVRPGDLRQVFRGSTAWGVLIVEGGTKGTVRLAY